MTNFEKVVTFNKLVGNPIGEPANILSQLEMLKEEFNELCEAVLSDDKIEIRDGIADVLYVAYGLAYQCGINADADFGLVHESNMSKFVIGSQTLACAEADEIESKMHIYVNVRKVETTDNVYALRSAWDQKGRDGKQYPMGKLLKPSTFKPVSFEE